MKRNKTRSACKIIEDTKDQSWMDWSFVMRIRERDDGAIKLNVLHVAIIMQNSELIDAILRILRSNADNGFLDKRVENAVKVSHKGVQPELTWIYGASILHLAARFFAACIPKLLEQSDFLINEQENEARMTPLHVAAIGKKSLATKILLEQDTNVQTMDHEHYTKFQTTDKLKRSPLFYAAKNRNYEDAMFLVTEGCCDIFEPDENGKKPFQVTSCSKIMKFFISRMSVEMLHKKDPKNELLQFKDAKENYNCDG